MAIINTPPSDRTRSPRGHLGDVFEAYHPENRHLSQETA